MKHNLLIAVIFVPCFLILLSCQNKNFSGNRMKLLDSRIAVDANNIPKDSNQFYFPITLFPKLEYVYHYKDSTTILVSTYYSNHGDTLRSYARIIPHQFDTVYVKEYSKYLYAMREPLLFNRLLSKEVYRFVWLRSFHNPIIIRIEKDKNKKYELIWKVTNGKGGYYPGQLIVNKRKYISGKEWNVFHKYISGMNFWKQKNVHEQWGCDGAVWLLEGETSDFYNVIHSWSVGNPDLHEACRYLIQLTGIKLNHEDIY
jgi:hypothetical protein